KTTTYLELRKYLNADGKIALDENYKLEKSIWHNIKNRIISALTRNKQSKISNPYIDRFGQNNPHFVAHYWTGMYERHSNKWPISTILNRMIAATNLFGKIEYLSDIKDQEYIVVQEGILHWMYDALGRN